MAARRRSPGLTANLARDDLVFCERNLCVVHRAVLDVLPRAGYDLHVRLGGQHPVVGAAREATERRAAGPLRRSLRRVPSHAGYEFCAQARCTCILPPPPCTLVLT